MIDEDLLIEALDILSDALRSKQRAAWLADRPDTRLSTIRCNEEVHS